MIVTGTLKDLEKPCTVLFRLAQGVILDHVAEVPLPIRFLFVCIGPELKTVEYLEIGRSLSTLMSNKVSQTNTCNATRVCTAAP